MTDEAASPTVMLKAIFSEPIKAGSGSIQLTPLQFDDRAMSCGTTREEGVAVVTVPIDGSSGIVAIHSSTLLFAPASALAQGHCWQVDLPSGVVSDMSGNAFGGSDDWTFRTEDKLASAVLSNVAPTVTAAEPSGANVVVSTHLKFTFSEPVVAGTGSLELTATGASTQTLTSSSAEYFDEVVYWFPAELAAGKVGCVGREIVD